MSKNGKLSPRKSIKVRSLLLLLGYTTLGAVVLGLIAFSVTRLSGQSAQQTASQALLNQAEDYLVQLTQSSARENDLVLKQVQQEVEKIAVYTSNVFTNSDVLATDNYWSLEERMSYGEEGQFQNGPEDISSVFAPNTSEIDAQVVQDIQLSAYLDFIFESSFNNISNVEAIYFATPRDVVRYFPNIHLGAVLPPDFKASERVWFTGSTPENNPAGDTWWTPPYVDATGRGLVTTAATPVLGLSGELLGVVGLDMTLNGIKSSVEANYFLESGYSFLIDDTGHAIALPTQGYLDVLGRPAEADEVYVDLTLARTEFQPLIAEMMAGESGFQRITLDGKTKFVSFSPLQSTGWSIGSIVDSEDVLATIASLQSNINLTTRNIMLTRVLPVGLILLIFAILIGWFVTDRIVKPIQLLATEAEKLGRGQWDVNIPPSGEDELGLLADSFESMVTQIRGHVSDLEKKVAERTRDIERQTLQVRVAAEVARDASVIQDLDELLERAVDLIRGRFGFYHAGIFLVDDQNEFAVLRAATGKAGQNMIANGHKLKIGEVGIVGYATGTGKPRIALDVGEDAVHFKNPFLPDTRSEMALPLKIGNRTIGALDVQSQYPSAFTAEDITILQIMADQLAVAIENARLLKESQESLRELQAVYGRYSQQAWSNLRDAQEFLGYQYDRSGIHAIQPEETQTSQAPVLIPLEVRGQVIGHLEVWPDEEYQGAQTQDTFKALGVRISQAMESARLFEDASRRAERERIASDITAKIRSTNDPQHMLQEAARELRQALHASRVQVLLKPSRMDQSKTGGNGNDDSYPSPEYSNND